MSAGAAVAEDAVEPVQLERGGVPTAPWPHIPEGERDVAELISAIVRRGRGDEAPSVAHEERLGDDVERAIARAIESPVACGVPLAVAADLSRDAAYRRLIRRNAVILASHLYPLSLLVYGAELENITCLSHDHWLISTVGRKLSLIGGSPFSRDDDVIEFFRRVIRMRGVTGDQSITDATPIAETNIGSVIRICVAKRPAVSGRASVRVAIRVPARHKVRHLDDYVAQMIMPSGVAVFIRACVLGRANIMIAGGTGSGKTTLLRVLCGSVPEADHIVVVEDGAELHLDQDRGDGVAWHALSSALSSIPSIRAESEAQQLTMFDLVRHALRFQPDRLVLGESRGEEMAAVCKALMTGHDGSMTTIHAEDAELALDQAVQYVMENPRFGGDDRLARRIVEHALHLVVHIANQDGRRRVTGVLAVERGGNHKWVYRQTESGGLERRTHLLGNLSRLDARVRPHLDSVEVPPP
ncbi:MAG: Flp pilus assembly complex ATPase component TadA [Candidatus Dormibacteraeota bacterium]|nr:Flp pilus assembly complex ATPase component TadA [Candidatus Dormibacteraeota bacterium]MBV9526555.1 Flp pilus assembly complex ATPase component TadA [Candidatus Dormibacteraeota bacterium]